MMMNKGADQLPGYSAADLRLFSHMQKAGFSITQLILIQLFHRLVLFQFMLPVVQITLFCVCIGADPFHLHVAVINNDTGLLGYNMGQKFLDSLDDYTVYQVR